MKKSLFLIPTIPLMTMTPMVSCGLNATSNQDFSILNNQNGEEDQKGACTFVYVGKELTTDGLPLMCRCMDMGSTCEVHLKVYERDELANQTFVGKNGFTYTLPEHTAKCVVAPVNKNINWGPNVDEMGLNEYGVVMSATLTTASNDNTALNPGVGGEPFVENGIAEETIAHTIIPSVKTAREGVQLLVDIISGEKGNAYSEAVFIADQKECWYVELLNGHKAVGVKLPDDKMFVQGNENGLHTLTDFATNEIIASPGYDKVPYRVPADTSQPIDLFKTYGRPLEERTGDHASPTDGAHRRTWRGLNLFGGSEYETYNSTEEYNWMFTPVTKPGMEEEIPTGVEISVDDVMGIYRDEFNDILADESDPNHEAFLEDYNNLSLRTIAWNTTGQTHFLRVDPEAEQSMAAQAWLSLSPSMYAPYVPLTAAITDAADCYKYVSPNDDYSPQSAYWAYRNLNTLCLQARDFEETTKELKYPNFHAENVVRALNAYQKVWEQQWEQVTDYAKTMDDLAKRNGFLTNYCTHVQNESFKLVKDLAYDAQLYYMNYNPRKAPSASATFYPLVDIEEFVKKYGYTVNHKANTLNITKGDKNYDVIMPSGMVGVLGSIKKNGVTIDHELQATYKDGVAYIDFMKAIDLFAEDVIAPLDVNEYMPQNNMLVWLIPTIFGIAAVVVGGVLAFYFLYWKKRHPKFNKQ